MTANRDVHVHPYAELIEAVADHLPIGVVVLDRSGHVLCVNRYEREVAQRYAENVVGRNFFSEVAPCLDVRGLAGAFRAGIARNDVRIDTELSFRFEHLAQPRDVRLSVRSFLVEGQQYAVVCLQDIGAFREAERRREIMAAMVVHDLKTPLAAVAVDLEGALAQLGGAHPARPALEAARAGVARTARLATTLLELRRLARAENAGTEMMEVDLVLLVDATVRALESLARVQQVALEVTGEVSVPIWCDAGLVRRALENLIDNALRAAPEGTCVTVEVSRTEGAARVAVIDRGGGVPAELRTMVFDAGGTTEGAPWNFGLGLTLVSMVAQRHGGRAYIEDTPGGGATFVLELGDRQG